MLSPRTFPALQDPQTRRYAIQLTVAALAAMTIANLFHVTNPWWAAMAVWMVSQPTRGLLLERSAAQLIGTAIGATVGAGLIRLLTHQWLLLLSMSVWLALCCAVANTMRHQRAYGGAMAGLACCVVVVMAPYSGVDPTEFAIARIVDTVIGIIAAIAFVGLWNPMGPGAALAKRARELIQESLSLSGYLLGRIDATELAIRERKLLSGLATLEASSEDAASGSLTYRRQLHSLRGMLAALLDVLAIARALHDRAERHGIQLHACSEALEEYAQTITLDVEKRDIAVRQLQMRFGKAREQFPVLAPLLDALSTALAAARSDYRGLAAIMPRAAAGVALAHPDFAGMRRAVLRSLVATFLAITVWLVTGNEIVRFTVFAACAYTTLFSTADEPAPLLKQYLIGGVGACIAMLLWRGVLTPLLQNSYLELLFAVPFMFLSCVVQAHRPTLYIGLSLNVLFAIIAHPLQLQETAAPLLAGTALAVLLGLCISLACARWIVPMSIAHRRTHLRHAMLAEIGAIAARARDPRAARHLARMRYLTLDLLARIGTSVELAHGALAALVVGHSALRIGTLLEDATLTDGAHRAALAALHELQMKDQSPAHVSGSLIRAALEMESESASSLAMLELAQSLRDAAASLGRQPAFFA
jgi:uncharacterized membrane protein YgaE (UPF0421/DUF939 family)